MPLSQYPSGTFTFSHGVATLTGYVIQAFDTDASAANTLEIENESGNVVYRRYDDITTNLTIEGVINGANLPVPGAKVTYDGSNYSCENVAIKGTNKDVRRVTIKAKRSEYVTIP